jgi:hypothetical protein
VIRLASVKLSVTGKENVPPEGTDAGNVAGPTWKIVEARLGLGFVMATFAVQVTWMVDVWVTITLPKAIGFGLHVNGALKVFPPPPVTIMRALFLVTYTFPFPNTAR